MSGICFVKLHTASGGHEVWINLAKVESLREFDGFTQLVYGESAENLHYAKVIETPLQIAELAARVPQAMYGFRL